MNNDNLKRIQKLTKEKITVSNFQKDSIMNNRYNNKKQFNLLKTTIAACICIIFTSGLVFAKDIETFIKERFNFGLGDAIDTAAENGYIEEPNLEPVTSNTNITLPENNIEKIVDNINISTNIDSFLMDNYNLSVEFTFKFEETLKEYVDFDKLHHITLNDLIILDEENRIIYASTMMSQDKFNTFCNTHNLNYTFADHNENYMNCGLNCFPQNIVANQNTVGLVYNIYTEEFPKSKKLNFYFNEITFTTQTYEENNILENKTTLTGNWNLNVNVPEKMYNRTSENYRVISCTNDKFNIYAAKVMDTGFEIGIIISDIIKPEYPEGLREKEREIYNKYSGTENNNDEQTLELARLYASDNYLEKYNEYQFKAHPINVTGLNVWLLDEEKVKQILDPNTNKLEYKIPERTDGCYVLNSNGEKFTSTLSPSRKANNNFVAGNKYDFYETFNMTKYDSTNEITVIIEFYGEPVEIKLEKIIKQ